MARPKLACGALLSLLVSVAAWACNVPVFRYALERWPVENFEVIIFHRDPLSSVDQARVDRLRKTAEEQGANVSVEVVDLAQSPAPERLALWQAQSNASLPRVLIRAPGSEPADAPVWSGPLQELNADWLLSSPARAELAQRLLRGDSVVWVLVESGDRVQDDAAATLLTNELQKTQGSLKLPPSAPDDPAPRSALPLRIEFSVQRLARDAREELLIRMLLHEEQVEAGKTVVVPVFGRGRALTTLSGAELTPKILRQAAGFLCGACSCEVKELNPGKDLLVSAHWESALQGTPEQGLPPKITAGERVEIAPGTASLARSPAATPAPVLPPKQRRGLKLLAGAGLAIGSICVLLFGVVLLRSLRQR